MVNTFKLAAATLSLAAYASAGTGTGGAAAPSDDPAKGPYAEQWTALSKKCQGTLASLVDNKSDISVCSGAGKLFSQVVSNSAVDADKSLVPVLQTWLKGDLCSKDACYAGTVTEAYQGVSSSCSAELEQQAWIPLIAQSTLLNYENTRKALCLKDTGAKNNATSYCPTEILNNVEISGTPITYAQGKLGMQNPNALLSKVPSWSYCVPCGQGLLAPVIKALKVINADWAKSTEQAVDGKCGKGFADGSTPATLEDGTSDSSSNSTGGSGGAGGSGSGSGSGSGYGETADSGDKASFHIAGLATTATLLSSVAFMAWITL